MGKWTEAANKQREVFDTAVSYLTDEQALTVKGAYRQWEELVKSGMKVPKGTRFLHGGRLFRTEQSDYAFVPHYIPGGAGTESLFSKLDETHAGTLEDPIPYDGNMELLEGLHYIQNGVIYLCNRATGNPVYHALVDLINLYVQAVNS